MMENHPPRLKFLVFLILNVVLCWNNFVLGQQDPHYTHYMYNMSIINPAYATNRLGVFDLGAFYRSQWVSVEGAPQTISFSAHGAITRKVELGLSVFNDQIGNDINETVITGDFAYLINLNNVSSI